MFMLMPAYIDNLQRRGRNTYRSPSKREGHTVSPWNSSRVPFIAYPFEAAMNMLVSHYGKHTFAVREKLCRAFSIGRTSKSFFTMRFLGRTAKKNTQ
jgi:hypothetical protein